MAVFFAGRAEKKKKREKENGYEAMGMGLVTAAVVVKNRKKKKGRVFRTVFLCIFITVLLLAEVFTYFGGFGFFRNCPSFASNGFISVIKYWYQLKAVNDNE